MNRITTTAAGAATAVLLLTACGPSGDGPSTTTSKAATPPPAPTTAAPAAPRSLALGDTFTIKDRMSGQDVHVDVTALTYGPGARAEFRPDEVGQGAAGDTWASLQIQVCSKAGTIQPFSQSWQLATADGGRLSPGFVSSGPRPEFPADARVGAGDCVKGYLMYAVPKGQTPVEAVYAPDSVPDPTKWKLTG
jgi:hypothetical protein